MTESILLTPLSAPSLSLPNRIVMAPLTRGRADEGGYANEMMATYYAQRATAGLIVSEATAISAQGFGWNGAPMISSDAHAQSWQQVTQAVHAAGGRIFMQLWHMGRKSHPDFHKGELPVAPSALMAKDDFAMTPSGKKPLVTPRALDASELPGILDDYRAAARRAIAAGFDGVEIHAANGYLLDEFLRDGSNIRTDMYGGSIENRARFVLDVVDAVIETVGAAKTGIRLSPVNPVGDMHDSDPVALSAHLAQELDARALAYVHLIEARPPHRMADPNGTSVKAAVRQAFKGTLILNGNYDKDSAAAAVAAGEADAVAFGVPFISNPDLPARFAAGAPLNDIDKDTLYTAGAAGYTDYPFMKTAP